MKKCQTFLFSLSIFALCFVGLVAFLCCVSPDKGVRYREVRNPRTGRPLRERYPDNPPPTPTNVVPILNGKQALSLDESQVREFFTSNFSKEAEIRSEPNDDDRVWTVFPPTSYPIYKLWLVLTKGKTVEMGVRFRIPANDRSMALALIGLNPPPRPPDVNCDSAYWYGADGSDQLTAMYVTPDPSQGIAEATWQVKCVVVDSNYIGHTSVPNIK